MALTPEQREKRRNYIGSSDVYDIIAGNAYKVWAEKTGKLDDEPETDVMIRGRLLEPAIINFAAMSLGEIITDPEELEFPVHDLHILDHPDGIVDRTGYPLDAKSQGAYAKEIWGEEHTDEVPDRVIIQAHVHMMAMGKDFCHVPAYLAYREFQMFGVSLTKRSEYVISLISEKCHHFWNEHVVKDIPPEDNPPSLEVLKRIRREPKTIVDIPQDAVDMWLLAVEKRKECEKLEDKYKAVVLDDIGIAEAGRTPSGLLVTFYEQRTGGLLTKELAKDHPDIAALYANPGTHRVLRVKKT